MRTVYVTVYALRVCTGYIYRLHIYAESLLTMQVAMRVQLFTFGDCHDFVTIAMHTFPSSAIQEKKIACRRGSTNIIKHSRKIMNENNNNNNP